MLAEAFQVPFDRLPNVRGRPSARLPLGHTPWQGRAGGYKYPVLVLFQVDTVFHQPAFLPQTMWPAARRMPSPITLSVIFVFDRLRTSLGKASEGFQEQALRPLREDG